MLKLLLGPNILLIGPLTSNPPAPPCLSISSFHTSPAADCLLFHLNSGRFSHSSAVSCDAVHVLAFGRSSWDSDSGSPTVGQTINFTCDEGHVLAGASAIVCQENGTYDNQPPLCLSKCNRPLFVRLSAGHATAEVELVHVVRTWSATDRLTHSSIGHVSFFCLATVEWHLIQEVGYCCTSSLACVCVHGR